MEEAEDSLLLLLLLLDVGLGERVWVWDEAEGDGGMTKGKDAVGLKGRYSLMFRRKVKVDPSPSWFFPVERIIDLDMIMIVMDDVGSQGQGQGQGNIGNGLWVMGNT